MSCHSSYMHCGNSLHTDEFVCQFVDHVDIFSSVNINAVRPVPVLRPRLTRPCRGAVVNVESGVHIAFMVFGGRNTRNFNIMAFV